MDTTDPDILFDASGVCNHCHRYDTISRSRLFEPSERQSRLDALVAEIRAAGAGKNYDCIIGVSGGVDSTYVALLVKQLGLRPLAVHLDNGWNSELAVGNIERTLKALGIDLYTYVIDWEEFRDLQLSFLKAGTPDGEVPTDHAIFALLYRVAAKYGLRHVISGTNVATEGVLPEKWAYGFVDWRYISGVHRRFGKTRLRSYPRLSLIKFAWYLFARRIRYVSILNYIEYDKEDAMRVLQEDLGWIYYGGKHYESIYTRFYQAYVLPRRFAIDKRKAHYSALICAGQMSRSDALSAMEAPPYPEDLLRRDYEYVTKKFGLSGEELEVILSVPRQTFESFANSRALFAFAKRFVNANRRLIG